MKLKKYFVFLLVVVAVLVVGVFVYHHNSQKKAVSSDFDLMVDVKILTSDEMKQIITDSEVILNF